MRQTCQACQFSRIQPFICMLQTGWWNFAIGKSLTHRVREPGVQELGNYSCGYGFTVDGIPLIAGPSSAYF